MGKLDDLEAAYAYMKNKYGTTGWTQWYATQSSVMSQDYVQLAVNPVPSLPHPGGGAIPGTIAGQAAAAKAAASGPPGTKHIRTPEGMRKFKGGIGNLIIPHGRHFVKGAPGHWVHGWISQEKWIANQWKKHPHNPGLAHHAIQAGSHKLVQAGEHALAVHKSVEVHVPKTTDVDNPVAVKNATKVLVSPHAGEHAVFHPQTGLGKPEPLGEEHKKVLAQSYKPLPHGGVTKKSVGFEGKHAAWVPHDWQVYKGNKPDAHLQGKWAKDPQGNWHLIHKNGNIAPHNNQDPDTWLQKGGIVPDEGHPSAGASPDHIAPTTEPGHEPGKVDVGGVAVTKDEIKSAIAHLQAAQSTNVKGPLKSKGHPLQNMDYMGISKAELAAHPELKVSAGTKQKHVGQVKLAVLHHLQGKLDQLSKNEAEQAHQEQVAKQVKETAAQAKKLTPALKKWGGVEATKEQLGEAADWLDATMGGKQSFKQAMNKTGNPLASADYMQAAKDYQKAHPASTKGWSTKKLMLESIKELQGQAQVADQQTGHDTAAFIHEAVAKLDGNPAKLKKNWQLSADGAIVQAMSLAAKYKLNYYVALSNSAPGVWDVGSFPVSPDVQHMVASPHGKVIMNLAGGGSHDYDEGHLAEMVAEWSAKEPEAPKTITVPKLKVNEPQPAFKEPEPPPEPEKKAGFNVPPSLAKFLQKDPPATPKGVDIYSSLPDQIRQAFLHSKKTEHPVYVGQVPHAGDTPETSWVHQFAKPSHGTYYKVQVMNFGGVLVPSLAKYEDGGPFGGEAYSFTHIEDIIARRAKPEQVPDKTPPSLSEVLEKAKAEAKSEKTPAEFGQGQVPVAEWISNHQFPELHSAVSGATTIPNAKSTDSAIAKGLYMANHFGQNRYLIPSATGGWASVKEHPSSGSYGAPSSWPSGFYTVTPDHQVIQTDKFGIETALPAESILDIANEHLKPAGAPEKAPELGKGFDVTAGDSTYHAPAGSKVYVSTDHPDLNPGSGHADVKYVHEPDGTWMYVQKKTGMAQGVGQMAPGTEHSLNQDLKTGKMVPWVKPEGKPVEVHIGGKLVYHAQPGTTLWYDGTEDPSDPNLYVYMKSPDGQWNYVKGDGKVQESLASKETLNESVQTGMFKPYDQATKQVSKDMGNTILDSPPKPKDPEAEAAPAKALPDVEIKAGGEVIGHAPAGSKVYWYKDSKLGEDKSSKYVKTPDGTWLLYSKSDGKASSAAGYDNYVADGTFLEVGHSEPDKADSPLIPVPEAPPKDIPVVTSDGLSKGMVPAGSKFYTFTDNNHAAWVYVQKPDGTWWKSQASSSGLSKLYSNPLEGPDKDKIKPGGEPTKEQIAKVEAMAATKKALDTGAISKATGQKSGMAYVAYLLASRSSNYWHNEYTAYQTDNGTWIQGYPTPGKPYYRIFPKSLTAEWKVPPSPSNETGTTTKIGFEEIQAAVNEHLVPNSVQIGSKTYQYGYWYNPKGKAYLEIKQGTGGYHPEDKASYVWHQVNGNVKYVSSMYAEAQLQKNTEWHATPKPQAGDQALKNVKYASTYGPGNWKLYSAKEPSGVAQSYLDAKEDGSAVYHDPGLGDKTLPESGVEGLLAGGTLLDTHGTTVVKPGVSPGAYHLFGSKGKTEAEMAAFLDQLEKADPFDWAKHFYTFMGGTESKLGPEASNLFAGWWNGQGKATGAAQHDAMKALVRELLLIPKQEAAKSAEAVFLKSMPEGIHGPKQVFKWTDHGYAQPYSGTLTADWIDGPYHTSTDLGDKIKAISAEYGGGKVVGTHVASMSKEQKKIWLKAWKAGDMAGVFEVDAATGKVSPAHPGAPKNKITHQVNWSPLDPSQVPASMKIEGDWTPSHVVMPKKEVNNYIIKMGFKHPEWLSEQQKLVLVGAHLNHDQDQVDYFTKQVTDAFNSGQPGKTNTPTWTEGLKPAKSYEAALEGQQDPAQWSSAAKTDFIADHKPELEPFIQAVAKQHGYSSPESMMGSPGIQAEVIKQWMDDVHAKHVAEQSVPVWKKVDTGALPSHGHPVYKYVKTIPYTGDSSTWYVKPAPKAGQEWRLEQEHGANMLGRALGFQTAHSEITKIDGQTMQAQAEIKGKPLGQHTDMQPWSTFTPEQIADIAAEHLLDWVVSNDDSSPNNLIMREDGKIIGIDKGRAWGNTQWPGLAGDKSMDTMTKLIYTKLYDAIRSHKISKETADAAFIRVIKQARKMEATNDGKLRAILEQAFANRPAKYGETKPIIDETIDRKNGLEEAFTKMWAQVYADAGYAAGSAEGDPHAEGTPWGPVQGKGTHGVILFDKNGNVMLREPSNHFGQYAWTFSKGGSNPGETPLQAAIRETAEETKLKAHSVLGYVPGGFGGTTSSAYFYFGLKDHTTDAPEMDNGETWNVKWVPYEEAKKLIAQTGELGNAKGMNRDLKILDAAYQAYNDSKKQGFPVMESSAPGGDTGLPEVPKAALGLSHGGVPIHSGFSEPDFIDHVHASKSFGQAAFFAGPDIEYQHFVVWKELDKNKNDVIHGEGGARGAGLKAIEAWAKARVKGGGVTGIPEDDKQTVYEGSEDLPGPAPASSPDRAGLDGEVGFYNKIIKAARTVSRHALDKKFNAGVLAEMDSVQTQLKKLLEGMDHIDPKNEWVVSAKPAVVKYLDYIDQVNNAKNTGGTFKPGDLPRYLPPEKPKKEPEKPKESLVKVTMRKPWRPATADSTNMAALSQEDGQLVTGDGKSNFENSGSVYHLELPTGEWIDIYPGGGHNNESNDHGVNLAHYGHIKFKAVAEDGSKSLERIREQLQEMGLPMEEAQPHDMELYYWRHMFHVMNERRDGPEGNSKNPTYAKVAQVVDQAKKDHGIAPNVDLERGGLSPEDELAIWHKAWGNVTSEAHVQEFADNGGHLPHFKHYNLHDVNQAGGRPVWHRFDMDQKMVSGWKMPDHIFVTHPEKGAVRIIRSGGQYSKDFRFRHLGLALSGQGNPPSTGATDFVFANLNSEKGHVIANPRILAQTTNYGWSGDNWGRLWNRKSMSYFDPEKAAAWNGMETMFQGGWSLLDDIEAVRAASSTQRQQMIDELHNLGIYTIRGLPVEDRIGTDGTWSETRKKIREHWKAHPELLDPHYEPELASEAGAKQAESGKAAAKNAAPAAPATPAGDQLYTYHQLPEVKYLKKADGSWEITQPGKAPEIYKAGDPAADSLDTSIKEGDLLPQATPQAAPKGTSLPPVTKVETGSPEGNDYANDPKNEVYTNPDIPGYHYVKQPGDGWWYKVTNKGKVTAYAPSDNTTASYNHYVQTGDMKLLKPATAGAAGKSPSTTSIPGDVQEYMNPSMPNHKYFKLKNGDWKVIGKSGGAHIYSQGSHSAGAYDKMVEAGTFKPKGGVVAEPGGPATPGISTGNAKADIWANDPANEVYTKPGLAGNYFIKTPGGDWTKVKDGQIYHKPEGSFTANNYEHMLQQGSLVKTEKPKPEAKVYHFPGSPEKYIQQPNGDWHTIDAGGKVIKDSAGTQAAKVLDKMAAKEDPLKPWTPEAASPGFSFYGHDLPAGTKVYQMTDGQGSGRPALFPDGHWAMLFPDGKQEFVTANAAMNWLENGQLMDVTAKASANQPMPVVGEDGQSLLDDVANAVYTNSSNGYKFVKTPDGHWFSLNQSNKVTNIYGAKSSGAQVANDMAASGELNLLAEPGEGAQTPSIPDFFNNPGYTVYTDPNNPKKLYVKGQSGDWYITEGTNIIAIHQSGSASAADYNELVSDGSIVQASVVAKKATHVDQFGNEYLVFTPQPFDYGEAFKQIMKGQDELIKAVTSISGT